MHRDREGGLRETSRIWQQGDFSSVHFTRLVGLYKG